MKVFIVFALAILAYVEADCGCLKCSKHLTIAGEINGAPGHKPIKVIYRCQNGIGSCPHYPNALPIEVQKPLAIPEETPPLSCGKGQYSYGMQAFYNNPSFISSYQGIYDNSHHGFSHGITHGTSHDSTNGGTDDSYAQGLGIHPITVQKPIPVSGGDITNCVPMSGLKASIDRVVLPSNPFPAFRKLIDSTDRYNPVYKDCPQLLCQRERHSCKKCCGCAPPPTIQLLHENRYIHSKMKILPSKNNLKTEHEESHYRTKRQLPFLDHGYKFFMNMLPPFIQDPIKNAVNIMALTHPDKKIQKMYKQPPKKTLPEKLLDQHKKNVANLKAKLLGPTHKRNHLKKSTIHNDFLSREAGVFIDSLQELPSESKKLKIAGLKMRTPLSGEEKEYKTINDNKWLREMTVHDILDDDSKSDQNSPEKTMTNAEKLLFRLKLKELNAHRRSKREIPCLNDTDVCREKRSIIIDSEEFSLPLYQVKIGDSDEESAEHGDSEEDDYYGAKERIVGKIKGKIYDEDDEDSYEPTIILAKSRKMSRDDSREIVIRKAIREELQKLNRKQSSEETVASHPRLNRLVSQSPLINLLSLPMKFFSGLNDLNKKTIPLVGTVPKIIVGTKKYFRDFGKNFKKNTLNFVSDVIGDFDHDGPTENILGDIFRPKRYKRSVQGLDTGLGRTKNNSETKMPEFTSDSMRGDNTGCENKVRKKRYIVKVVDDDEIEAILRRKLERLFDDSNESYKPQKKRQRMPKYSEDRYSGEVLQSRRFSRKKHYDVSEEDHKRKVVVQKIRPKVIIDNNGLPFMELDGYKRPILMSSRKFRNRKIYESSEDQTLTNYDSSEEANLQKIHGVIDFAKNCQVQSTRNIDMPLQTLKEKISQLLFETDALVHMNFEKYDEIYDDLINIQQIKTSTVQDWKRLIMEKKINDREAKIALLGKLHEMQRIKEIALKNIVYALYLDNDNKFVVKEFTKMLVRLQKLQCVVNQVVASFQEKFSLGTKFELSKEIKYVEYLASTNFVYAKTRNDLIAKLKEARDNELQANIQQLDKLKKMLVKNDENIIDEESNILWEMKNIEKMQIDNIEEMYHNMEEGGRIKKNLKILFDFSKRMQVLEAEEKRLYSKCESQESSEDIEVSIEKSIKIETSPKKIDIEQFKKKWQDKVKKRKFLIEKNLKKTLVKLNVKEGSDESD